MGFILLTRKYLGLFFANLNFHTEDYFDKILEQRKQKTCMKDKIRFSFDY